LSESELIEHLFSIYDRCWTIVQWWSSVSFSLIIVAYLAADRLSKGIVATLLGLYTLYTIWVYSLMAYNINMAVALLGDLESLRVAGSLRSQGGMTALQDQLPVYGIWLGNIAQLATFIACVGYFLYAFRQARKRATT
jgi:hypothetical protein